MKAVVNGISINYEVFGTDGPWVVLSHSLACNLRMWGPQINFLQESYRVLAFDTRGHGGSEAAKSPYTLDMLSDDSIALLEHLEIDKPHWIGLSMGGMIGMTIAIKHPKKFRSLTLADTTSRIPNELWPIWTTRIEQSASKGMASLVDQTLQRWFTSEFIDRSPPDLKFVAAMIESTPTEGYIGCCQAIPKINCTAELHRINCPIQIVVGEQDAGTPVQMSEEIHAAAPGSELVVIPHASHLSNLEQPQLFNDAVERFLLRH